jgi:nucleoside-diphosphate-sugar epimerase
MEIILLTGASGFIGQNIIKELQNKSLNILLCSRAFGFDYKKIDTNYIDKESVKTILHLAGINHDLKKTSNSDEYYQVNTELTKKVFDAFLASNAKVFITLSSVKAVADEVEGELTEDHISTPITHYGKSKLLAEQYITSKQIPKGKRVYILRPCMIHGPGNKGNLNLLNKLVSKGIPWPLGSFDNKRSFCSIDNLMFIIKELIEVDYIPSGVYNVADDETLSTNDVISILAKSQNKKISIWKVSKGLIQILAKLGDVLQLSLTTERLQKLTESYVVSNQKIKSAIKKDLPVSCRDGLLKTFNSFCINDK